VLGIKVALGSESASFAAGIVVFVPIPFVLGRLVNGESATSGKLKFILKNFEFV
jgi:hypothetical protein